VGYGSIGRRHLANLEQLGVGHRLVVRRAEGASGAVAPPPDARVVHGDDEAIDLGLDAAIICNPTRLHVATAERYLAAGVAVLIEKPLCAIGDEEAAARLAAMAADTGVTAGMAYCLRYQPAYRQAQAVLASGCLGRLRRVTAWFESYLPDWHPWEDHRQSYAARADLGGGVLPTLDHEIDLLNWCLGEPQRVAGRLTNSGTLGIDVPDTARVELQYAGLSADVRLSFCCRERSRGFAFAGSAGILRFDWDQGLLELATAAGGREALWQAATPSGSYDLNDMYRELLDDFLLALERRAAAPVPLSAGLAAARVCAAAASRH
jgi:predicted dehydrogenase